jgi:hypothetical protein
LFLHFALISAAPPCLPSLLSFSLVSLLLIVHASQPASRLPWCLTFS